MYNNYFTLITGASEGLGKALAIECAQRKMNLVLVALPGPELHSLAGFIKHNYQVEVVCIEKDLCRDESCMEVFNEVNALNLKVNMLINNAGIGSTVSFGEGSTSLYEKQVKLNVLATTLITRLFLDMLTRNCPSYILNVASMASFFYLPKKQVYGATKSFICFFSKCLHRELKKDKIHVSVLCPGGMNTNLAVTSMNKKGNFLTRLSIMDPEKVAPLAVDGLLNKREVIVPGRMNQFFLVLNNVLPGFIKEMIMDHSIKKMRSDIQFTSHLARPMNIRGSGKAA